MSATATETYFSWTFIAAATSAGFFSSLPLRGTGGQPIQEYGREILTSLGFCFSVFIGTSFFVVRLYYKNNCSRASNKIP